jgi:hypothetical protein
MLLAIFFNFGRVSHTKISTGHLLSPTVSEASKGGRTDYYPYASRYKIQATRPHHEVLSRRSSLQ